MTEDRGWKMANFDPLSSILHPRPSVPWHRKLTTHGEVVAQHVVLPLHMGAFPACAAAILKTFALSEIDEGDAFITNHPYLGGSPHAPDMAALSPLFFRGEWVGFAANLAHNRAIA